MDKTLSNESFSAGLPALQKTANTKTNAIPKKLTGSFNAGLKTLRMLATKQNQAQSAKNDGNSASNTAK